LLRLEAHACFFPLHLTPPLPTPFAQVYRLITKGTVDQNIYNLSQRKLRMDSAVLDGITSGKGGKADESAQMGFILHVRGPGSWDAALCVRACLCWSEACGCNLQLPGLPRLLPTAMLPARSLTPPALRPPRAVAHHVIRARRRGRAGQWCCGMICSASIATPPLHSLRNELTFHFY